MTEHEKRTMNQVPSDPRRRRKNSEPSEEVAAKKRKPNSQTGMKSGGLTISCRFSFIMVTGCLNRV